MNATKGLTLVCVLCVASLSGIALTYLTVPDRNTDASHFDTLIVLGCPSEPDGSPSPEQRERMLAAVREFRAGRAGALLISGGPSMHGNVESDAMMRVAVESGVPADRIAEERQALNTLQNIFFSQRIMQQKGWQTAEVISSPSHLPRTSLILEHWNFGWRVKASQWPASYSFQRISFVYGYEALGTSALRWSGFPRSPYLPEAKSNVQFRGGSARPSTE